MKISLEVAPVDTKKCQRANEKKNRKELTDFMSFDSDTSSSSVQADFKKKQKKKTSFNVG